MKDQQPYGINYAGLMANGVELVWRCRAQVRSTAWEVLVKSAITEIHVSTLCRRHWQRRRWREYSGLDESVWSQRMGQVMIIREENAGVEEVPNRFQ